LHCSSIVDHAAGHEEHAKDVNFFWVEVHWSGFSLLNWEYTDDHHGRFTSCPWITNENSYLEMNAFMSWWIPGYLHFSFSSVANPDFWELELWSWCHVCAHVQRASRSLGSS
jgi:hypothetical protein